MMTHSSDALADLRRKGLVWLSVAGWFATACLIALSPFTVLPAGDAIMISALVNLIPTWCAWHGRFDGAARMSAGIMAAAQPALLVFVMRESGWQIDMHMYFFVALAMLTVLCDVRPFLIAASLIALHHVTLAYTAPEWVFAGGGGWQRVLVHALAVVLQCGALCFIAVSLQKLFANVSRARDESIAATDRAEAALREVESERARNETLTEEANASRRAELLALADDFERSVSGVAQAVGEAAGTLDRAAQSLDDVARDTGSQAADVAASAAQASQAAQTVAANIARLSQSIGTIAINAGQQSELSGHAAKRSNDGDRALGSLGERSANIGASAQTIAGIAAKTNLLALNAAIEAASAGEAGRGFAVVAQEVKDLARQAGAATTEITEVLAAMENGTLEAETSFRQIGEAIAELTTTATEIRREVEAQRLAASQIESSADDTASGVGQMAARIGSVAQSVRTTEQLSGEVRTAARALADQADALHRATGSFVRNLRAA